MTLPKIDLPTFTLAIPSIGITSVKARPFTVKEEKLLLMASESEDVNEVIDTTLQVLNNCILEENFDVTKLPFFDIDYLFIALRAKSISESIEVQFTCNAIVNNERCGTVFPANIDIANVIVVKADIPAEIDIGEGRRVTMRYPTYSEMKRLAESEQTIDKKIRLVAMCIDTVYDKDTVYSKKDYTQSDLMEFVETMSENTFKKLENFVDNFPSFVVLADANCTKCGFRHTLRYTDFERFFT